MGIDALRTAPTGGGAVLCVLAAVALCSLQACRTPRAPAERVLPETYESQPDLERATVPEGAGSLIFTPFESTADDPLRLSDQSIPYPAVDSPERLQPLLEWGMPFLENVPLQPGIETPAGQVLQPSFIVYGKYRSALQSFNDGRRTNSEWANRLDLHGDLKLSGTERLVLSLRPIDTDRGAHSGYNFRPDDRDQGWTGAFNARPRALFFEGELGEIFPRLDPADTGTYDLGFSVGRQPLVVQEGVLVDDDLDMLGVTRNSLTLFGVSNLRLTGIFAWDEVNRGDNRKEDGSYLFGFLSSADTARSTLSFDLLYVLSDDDLANAWYVGAGATQRSGEFNTTFRAAGSFPSHDDTPAASGGYWFSSSLSRTLRGSDNIAYWNAFWAPDEFTSAARGDDRGGSEGGTGILFEPVGIGRYGVAMGGATADTVGTALGTQLFLDGIGEQVVLEVGARETTDGTNGGRIGFGARYQRAVGDRHVFRVDVFAAGLDGSEAAYGFRIEWLLEF